MSSLPGEEALKELIETYSERNSATSSLIVELAEQLLATMDNLEDFMQEKREE